MRTITARWSATLALLLTACWPALATDGTLTGSGTLDTGSDVTTTFSVNVQQMGASIGGTASIHEGYSDGSWQQFDIQITSGDIAGDMFGSLRYTNPTGTDFTFHGSRFAYSTIGGSFGLGSLGYELKRFDSYSIKSGGIVLTLAPSYSISLLYDASRSVKSGAAYPIKIQVMGASGANVSSSSLAVTALGIVKKDSVPDGPLQDTGNANPDFGFRYDASLGGYLYNVKTSGLSAGTYAVPFKVGSSSQVYEARFNVR
jgi:hypothetical protein